MCADRRGFTLVELMVALAVGAIVLIGGRALVEGVGMQASAVVRASRTVDERASALRTTRQVVGNLTVSPSVDAGFVGDAVRSRFASWCPSAWGETEVCKATLFIVAAAKGIAVRLTTSSGLTVDLVEGARAARLEYVSTTTGEARLVPTWPSPFTTPLGIAVISDQDTLLLRIGDRR